MIPRGTLSPRAAITAAGAFLAFGLLAAAPLGGVVVALIALGTSAGLAYNAYFKRSVWTWLPFWIALPTLPVCAFVAMRRFQPRLCLAYLLGAPLVLGVYLADTLSDLESDRAHGIRGLAQTLGPESARLAGWISVASAIVLALATREKREAPGPIYPLAIGLLGIAPVLDRRRHVQLHWLAIMGSVVAIALAWLNDLAATQECA
jgi:4-hydroxybenzoate polyprenyltransferase